MTQQTINLGTADKGNGDVLRTAFGKVNDNFAELYNQLAASVVVGATAPTGPEEGALWWNSESGRMYVYYGTAWVDASPVDGAGISSTNELVNGAYTVSLGSDGVLTLSNGTNIYGDGIFKADAVGGFEFNSFTDNIGGGKKTWTFSTDGNLTLPLQGKIMPVGDVNSFLTFNWGDDVELKAGDNLYLSGSVATIRTNGNANQWIFGTNGSLTFPDSTTQSTAWTGSVSSLVNGARTLSLDSDSTLTLPNFDILAGIGSKIKSALDIKIQAGAYYLSNLVQVEAGIWYLEFLISSAPDWATMVAVGDSVVSGTCVRQITDVSTPNAGQWRITVSGDFTGAGDPSSWSFYKPGATGSIWTFGSDGNLTAPGTITAPNLIVDDGNISFLGNGSGIQGAMSFNLSTNNFTNNWNFSEDGLLTFPGADGFQATFGSVEPVGDVLQTINNLLLSSESEVSIRTDSASETSPLWTFGTDGALTFPDASVIASYKPVTVIAQTTNTRTINDQASAAYILFTETVDTANAYANGMFTAPYTGYYQFNVSIYFSTSVTLNSGSFFIIDNSSDATKSVTIMQDAWTGQYLHYSTVVQATAGDIIVCFVLRNASGANIELASGCRLTIHRVSIS